MIKIAGPDFVTRVMRDPRVWHWVKEDGLQPEQFGYRNGAIYFQHEQWGFVVFRSITNKMCEIHIAMLRGAKKVKQFVMECLEEMRRRGVSKFLAPIGSWNKAAIKLARDCGFKEEGRISNAYFRDGIGYSMVMMGGY